MGYEPVCRVLGLGVLPPRVPPSRPARQASSARDSEKRLRLGPDKLGSIFSLFRPLMRSRAKSLQLNEAPKHVFWGCLWACPEAPTLTSTVSRAIQPKLQGGGHTVSVFEGAEVAALCHAPAVTARCLYAAHGTPATCGRYPNHLHPHAHNRS